MEKDHEKWREKFWWIFKGEEEQRRLKALKDETDSSNTRKNNSLKHEPLLRVCDVNGQSNLMFMANTYVSELIIFSYMKHFSNIIK